jgi:hypothetical protein
MLFKDGRIYRGNWMNDMFSGKGTLKLKMGRSMIIEGTFADNKLQNGQVKV